MRNFLSPTAPRELNLFLTKRPQDRHCSLSLIVLRYSWPFRYRQLEDQSLRKHDEDTLLVTFDVPRYQNSRRKTTSITPIRVLDRKWITPPRSYPQHHTFQSHPHNRVYLRKRHCLHRFLPLWRIRSFFLKLVRLGVGIGSTAFQTYMKWS
jgi:hypothetical protein